MCNKGVAIPVALILIAAIAWGLLISRTRALARSQDLTQVLVARFDLPAHTPLTEDMVEVMKVPRLYIQQDAVEVRMPLDIGLVKDLVSAIRIPKGNQITLSALTSPAPKAGTNDKVQTGQRHYLEGLKYFQNADYEKARAEWTLAKKLDSSNAEVKEGLKRIEAVLAPRK